ncbi:MAG: HAMP domain-containing protein [Chloroflexi bacterium]|nr:HAMP domain-containing protein [Chloroflexota bacterium]
MNWLRHRKWIAHLWGWAGAVSIRTKIFGIVLGSTLLLSLGFTVQVRLALANFLQGEARAQGTSIARDVAARSADLILINDLYSLHQLLNEIQTNYANVRYVFVVDPQGQVLAHTFGNTGFPLSLLNINQVSPGEFQSTKVLQTDEGLVWDVAVPIFDGKAGTVRVGISDAQIHKTLQMLTSQLLYTVVLVLVGSLLAATSLTWILTRPILNLVEATGKIAQGDFSPRVARWANDEIGDLAVAFNQMADELSRTDELRREREQLRRQLLEGVISAQEDERRRISRELHDGTSQSLTSLIVGLRMLETESDLEKVSQQAHTLREVVRQTLEEIHGLAVQLRPSILDDIGLVAALEHYAHEYQNRFQIGIDFQTLGLDAKQRLPAPVETSIYRIVQEALTNAAKYAQAKHISILLKQSQGMVSTIIEDDGGGFDAAHILRTGLKESKLGLYGMQERASLLGGQVVIESTPGHGTTIYVRIPLERATNAKNTRHAGR